MEQPTHTRATLTSKPLTFRVKRQEQESFVAPTVLEAANNGTGPLDPINALPGATVRVRYEGMQTSDILAVDWDGGAMAAKWQSAQEVGSVFGYVDFLVPVSVVAASQGRSITVVYAVVRDEQPRLSQPLALAVGELADGDLNAPTVPEAPDKTLDLTTFTGDARVMAEPWPLIAQGQRYWIKVSGELENGNAHFFYVAENSPVTENEEKVGLDKPLLRTELEKFKNGTNLEIALSVAFDGSTPRQFPKLNIMLINVDLSPIFEDFKSFPSQQLVAGRTLTSVTGVIITPEVVGCKRGYCTGLWVLIGRPLTLVDGSIIRFDVENRATILTVSYQALNRAGHFIELFGDSGLIGSFPLPVNPTDYPVTYDILSYNNTPIRYIRVHGLIEPGEDIGYDIHSLKWWSK